MRHRTGGTILSGQVNYSPVLASITIAMSGKVAVGKVTPIITITDRCKILLTV
jgi:hypothetical protein